jgi:hypothetical protein
MKKFNKIASSFIVIILVLMVFTVNVSAYNTIINFSLPTMNAVFSTSDYTAYSNVATTTKGSTYSDYNVYRIEVTGTISTSETGVENYLYIYNETYDIGVDIPLPPRGSVSGSGLDVDIPLEGVWRVQLISHRPTAGTFGATTLSNGRVKFLCTY